MHIFICFYSALLLLSSSRHSIHWTDKMILFTSKKRFDFPIGRLKKSGCVIVVASLSDQRDKLRIEQLTHSLTLSGQRYADRPYAVQLGVICLSMHLFVCLCIWSFVCHCIWLFFFIVRLFPRVWGKSRMHIDFMRVFVCFYSESPLLFSLSLYHFIIVLRVQFIVASVYSAFCLFF